MKICQYVPHGAIPDKRGFAPAIVAQYLYKSFDKQNLKHYFVSNQEDYEKSYENNDDFGEIFRIKESYLYKKLFQKITKIDYNPLEKRLAKILNANPVDILHIHQVEFPVNKFKKFMNYELKIGLHVHSIRSFDISRGEADIYFAVSNYTKKRLVERGFPENKIKVLYNGVDVDKFFYEEDDVYNIKEKLDIPKSNIIVSYIGRRHESKGYNFSLKIFEYLLNKYKNITAICIGPLPKDAKKDSTYEESENIIEKLKNNPNFINLNALPHEKLIEFYKISDVFLFPSMSKAEQHPLVTVEALASKNILITSNIASIPEYIKHMDNGIVLKNPRDLEEVLRYIEEYINEPRKFNYIKENAYQTSKQFDWKNIAQQLIQYYKEIL